MSNDDGWYTEIFVFNLVCLYFVCVRCDAICFILMFALIRLCEKNEEKKIKLKMITK